MNDISGPFSIASSSSAVLQLSLESKLRAALDVNGSPEYALIWSTWDMPLGPPICRLRASAPHTSGSDCSGWPTPAVTNAHRGGMIERTTGRRRNLQDSALLAGWATPTSRDHKSDRNRKGEANWGTKGRPLTRQVLWTDPGATLSESIAGTGGSGALNPAFSRWLMGFPTAWDACAPMATRSSRKLQPRS